jgi:cell division septum initiation protein DivIVA
VNLPKSSIIDEIADHRDELLNENRKLNQRIKRLEEDGDESICALEYASRVRIWTEAKEAKP